MTKNPEDEKLVTKGAVKEGIRVWAKEHGGEFIFPFDLMVAIDQLPAEPVVNKQRLQERIRDYLRVRRGWISGTVEEFLDDIFEEKP